ncbi:MAG: hypothetical protein HXY43_13045 [Fischerella sp.]|jgi:hypothetical protein|uniref:hypothetical protein n=1 Tax=Fischerella sp. TaxID=1191 RepID=UPI0018350AFC|nr:hypothetical protein [Fischerella sp.]NWF60160.1 hypothetical protein [Fischerella sp.]
MSTPVKISNNSTNNFTKVLADTSKEEELMHEVLLIIENLAYREEATVKLIFDRLYDIGSINLINQNFRSRAVKKVLKLIARMSKPAFRIFAWHWFKKNSPQLITNWLRQQVSFKNQVTPTSKVIIERQVPQLNSFSELEHQNKEIQFLRSQVKILATILIGVVAFFGGSLIWLGQSIMTGRSQLQNVEQLPQVTIQEASVDRH